MIAFSVFSALIKFVTPVKMAKIQGFGSFSSIFIEVVFHGISLHFIVKTLNFHISKLAKFAIQVFCLEIRFFQKYQSLAFQKS
eukprot:UN22880